MKIGVDARTMFSSTPRGTGKSLVDLYDCLARQVPDWTFHLYYEPADNISGPVKRFPDNVIPRPFSMRGSRWNLWEELALPLVALKDRLDLLHCPSQTSPRLKTVPTVVTIHDVIPLKVDEGWDEQSKLKLKENIGRSLKSARQVITVSENTKLDLIDLFPEADASSITSIHWAPECGAKQIVDTVVIKRIRSQYGLADSPFFFALGGESLRKNSWSLLLAFEQFSKRNPHHLLLLGGLQPDILAQWKADIASFHSADRIHLYGYLPEQDMSGLYSSADAYVFPSFYEGFGLPLLDAMACGCPLLASNVSSIPEVAGDAAVYFEPGDLDSIAECMETFVNQPGLKQSLCEAGEKRLESFGWDIAASKTLAVFQQALGMCTLKHSG